MFAALVKAAIFYWVFIMIRRLLRSSGILPDSKPRSNHVPPHNQSTQSAHKKQHGNDGDVIEADYRVID